MKALITFILLTLFVDASISDGKEIFARECATCHIQGKYFAAKKKAKEWKKLLSSDHLKKLHLEHNLSLPYLETPQFNEDRSDLKALLQKYSLDRGRHNSCY